MLTVLLDAGFDLETAHYAFTFISELVYANVRASARFALPREAGRDDFLAELRSLDALDVPVLRQIARIAGQSSLDSQFEYDLATALAGIAARLGADQR